MGCINIWNCPDYFSTLAPPPIGEKPLCKLPENMPIPGPKEGVALKREAKTEAARIRPRMTHVDKAPSHRSEDEGDEPPSDEEKGEGAPTSSSSESETSDTSLTEFRAKYGKAHDPPSGSHQPPP